MSEDKKRQSSLPKISARAGGYESYFSDMREASAQYRHPDGKFKGQNPLSMIDLTDQGDFLNGMFRSWSAVLEVLSFYQDRIVQEGYLATATEQFSLDQLVGTIGFQQSPELSATTWLAFTLSNKSNRAQYLIPKGTQAQNVPQGGRPQVFETIENKMGKPEWNQLSLHQDIQLTALAELPISASFCHVNPSCKGIKPKTHLWISAQYDAQPHDFFVEVREVLKLKDGTLLVFWGHPLEGDKTGTLTEVKITWMPDEVSLFGHDLQPWAKLATKDKQKYAQPSRTLATMEQLSGPWRDVAQSPKMDINKLLRLPDGILLAGGSKGILRSFDDGVSWIPSDDKLAKGYVTDLLEHEQVFYAVGRHGLVMCSFDKGQSWCLIRGNKPLSKEDKKNIAPGLLPALTFTTLVVMALEYKDGGVRQVLLLGSSKGVFYSVDEGHFWQAAEHLFYFANDNMPENVVVHDLEVDGSIVTASTSHGLYSAIIDHDSLKEKNGSEVHAKGPSFFSKHFPFESSAKKHSSKQNMEADVFASITVPTDLGNVTVFATDKHVYRVFDNKGLPFSEGLLLDEAGHIPRVNEFLVWESDLVAVTDRGIYVTHELGTEWLLKSTTEVWQVADPKIWQQALNKQQIPDDLFLNLKQFGLPVSKDATLIKGPDDKSWRLRESGCEDILLTADEDGLNIQLLNANNEPRLVAHLPEVYQYVEQLFVAMQIPESWVTLFAHIGVELSEKTVVVPQGYEERWLFMDKQSNVNFLADYSDEKLTVRQVHGANTATRCEGETLLIGTDEGSAIPSNWPEFWLKPDRLVLDVKSAKVQAGYDIFVQQFQPRHIMKKLSPNKITDRQISAFGKTAICTELSIENQDVSQFDRRYATVFVGDMMCDLVPMEKRSYQPIVEGEFIMNDMLPAFPVGHVLAITGQSALLQFATQNYNNEPDILCGVHADGQSIKLERKVLFSFVLKSADILVNLKKNTFCAELFKAFEKQKYAIQSNAFIRGVNAECWVLQQPDNMSYYLMYDKVENKIEVQREYYYPVLKSIEDGWVIKVDDQHIHVRKQPNIAVTWLAAEKETPSLSEIVHVSETRTTADRKTAVIFTHPLKNLYDPNTINMMGNMVPAVHGQTVKSEIIGSVRQDKVLQKFKLRRKPLSVWQDEQGQQHSSLTVKIRRNPAGQGRKAVYESWEQTDDILRSSPKDRHYQTIVDENGQTEILFGDGNNGAIPKAGVENVEVSYRYGGGEAGNLAAGTIKMLRGKPLGISAVVNPVASNGGADRETVDPIRQAAPASLRFNDVIVSYHDCLTFAQNFPGVSQAILQQPQETGHKVWLICIDTNLAGQAEILGLCHELSLAIMDKLTHPLQVKVVPANRIYFSMSAKIWLHDPSQWNKIEALLKSRLAQEFLQSRSNLAKGVDAVNIAALLQGYGEVLAAQVTDLKTPEQSAPTDKILAKGIHKGPQGKIQGADLLLTSEALISLSLEGVS